MSRPWLGTLLAIWALGLVVALGVLRISVGGASSTSPEAILPLLIAGAALCVFGLTVRRHPTAAWLALILALSTTTIDLATFAREQRPLIRADEWRWIAIALVLAASGAVAAAAGYAADPARRLPRGLAVLGVVAVVAVFAIGVWAIATPDPETATVGGVSPLGDLRLVTRAFLLVTAALVVLGLASDLRPAASRASRRLATGRGPSAGVKGTMRYVVDWIRTFVEELTLSRARERRAATTERARIARDLHAVVVPDLRRAIREAERVGSVDRLARSLREALQQIEAMIETRDSIGLEIGGLVSALESLAERVEDRSGVRVTIDVADGQGRRPGPPPADVAGAALRVATLALDNVVRHAPDATVRLVVATGADQLRMCIEDDGPGLPVDFESVALRDGGRGLADMMTEAELCGASVRSGRRDGGIGTTVTFDWPAI
jgi:signal transduction histidine kinase